MLTAEQHKAAFAEAVEPFGLPVPVARTLLLLDDPTSMRDLADQLACDPSHITGIADRLEERGLVRRVAGRDRRVRLLELTEDGVALRDELGTAAVAASPTSRLLDDGQRAVLMELLEQLVGQ